MHGSVCELFIWLEERYDFRRDHMSKIFLDKLHDRWHAAVEAANDLPENRTFDLIRQSETEIFLALKSIVGELENATSQS